MGRPFHFMPNSEYLLSENVVAFIRAQINADISQLMLNPPAQFKEYIRPIAEQIRSRQKIKDKLPQWYQDMHLIMPPTISTEQSSSAATSSYKSQLVNGAVLVDLTGGMGIDTLALAHQFKKAHYVDISAQLCKIFLHNSKILSTSDVEIHNADAQTFLNQFDGKATFFIDPARRDENQRKVFHFENCSPNIIDMLPHFKEKAVQVLVKAAPMIDISLGIKQLKYVKEVHVVSLKNEVKEVLFLLDFSVMEIPIINCVNLESDHQSFSFSLQEESSQSVEYGNQMQYLYDPNSSITKAGAFKTVAKQFRLKKLAPNTHLYTSDEFIEDFPGRIIEVFEATLTKKNINKLLPEGKANVMTKNHPQQAEILKKQLELKDGGDWFVIGFKNSNNKSKLLLGKKAKS